MKHLYEKMFENMKTLKIMLGIRFHIIDRNRHLNSNLHQNLHVPQETGLQEPKAADTRNQQES